jgi:dual specificity tyrosine-phosphorylation-regulated kinase 2/3/4
MDIWSFACIVIEMIIGKPMFPGDNEREQLAMLMHVLGPIPETLIPKCSRKKVFFTIDGKFIRGKGQRYQKPGTLSLEAATQITDPFLLDLLKMCFEWKQEDRISAEEALKHPWFQVKETMGMRSPRSHIFPGLIR